MRSSPASDERAAYLLTDVASAFDAGLSVEQILAGPTTASLAPPVAGVAAETLTDGLHRRGLDLAPHELLLLRTAEQAGTLTRALRTLAAQRQARADRQRDLRRRLAYPAFLLVFGFAVSILAAFATGGRPWVPVVITGGLLAAVYLAVRYALRSVHRDQGGRLPVVSGLVRNLGELPYLYSLHGLYGAGVKLAEAHELALKTSPIEGVRMRLFQAGQALAKDRTLSEALHQAAALHPETLQMLSAAEAAGDLEDALQRAITRRQDEADRQTRLLVRFAVAAITVLVYGYVAYVVFSFWLGHYSSIGRLLDR